MKNFGETEVSALTSTPDSFTGRSNHQVGGSTLVEGYFDDLTHPRVCPHNVLLPFPPLHAPTPSFKPHPGQMASGTWSASSVPVLKAPNTEAPKSMAINQ
ncbi:hypothetical protein TcG_11937 [Trypanosoma cruzi]|nr:hypothetical protein TcG_11937 [Trypanosoma cruzi]